MPRAAGFISPAVRGLPVASSAQEPSSPEEVVELPLERPATYLKPVPVPVTMLQEPRPGEAAGVPVQDQTLYICGTAM